MASIKRRDKTYQVQIRRSGYPSISKCFKTIREAKAWAAEQEAKLQSSQSPLKAIRDRHVPNLLEALKRYEAEVSHLKKSAAKEQSFIRYWCGSSVASEKITKITPQQVALCRDKLLQEGKSPASVVRMLALLSHVFSIATKEWGYYLINPVQMIRKPRVQNARSRRPSADELQSILQQIQNNEIRLFIQLAADTAMRRSELFNLSWQALDLNKRRVYLRDTKNGSDRVVVISNVSAGYLKALNPKAQGRVFAFRHVDTPSKAFRSALLAARQSYEAQCLSAGVSPKVCHLTNLKFHDLRHEATSALFERGLSIPEVASITGHKTLAMLGRYTHVLPELD